MAYCGPKGIPLSTFLGWPEADQEMALAWQAREATKCGGCGTYEADWDEANGGDRNAWGPSIHLCRGCEVLQKQSDDPQLKEFRGVHVRLARPERYGGR